MFGDIYKIKEEDIQNLVKQTRQRTILVRTILFSLLGVWVLYIFLPQIKKGDLTFFAPMALCIVLFVFAIMRAKKKNNVTDQLRQYELIISDGSIQCKYFYANKLNHLSIANNEVTSISHYAKDSILIVGRDLSHSFSIPKNIEKRDEIIQRLNHICAIDSGKKRMRLYYMQRVNAIVLLISAGFIMASGIRAVVLIACIGVLYSISLPVYFFLTTRNMSPAVKRINGIYVFFALLILIGGVGKLLSI